MKRQVTAIAITLAVFFIVSVSGPVHAKSRVTHYRVTITNLTRGQILSPPLVISHRGIFKLFTLGKPASMELAYLAEDANYAPMINFLEGQSSVFDFEVGDGPIMPGASTTIDIKTKSGFRLISALAMLVTTNDAFMAAQGAYARSWTKPVVDALAYDAGSEYNSENCDYIPGPPCDSGGVRDTAEAEGYVYVHSGIHGIGSLEPAEYSWLNPVARLHIERVK